MKILKHIDYTFLLLTMDFPYSILFYRKVMFSCPAISDLYPKV